MGLGDGIFGTGGGYEADPEKLDGRCQADTGWFRSTICAKARVENNVDNYQVHWIDACYVMSILMSMPGGSSW